MAARNCENCIHYKQKTVARPADDRSYEQILAEYQARQKPRIYTVPQPVIQSQENGCRISRKITKPQEAILPVRAIYKTEDLASDSVNEQWGYDEKGQLRIEGTRLGNLPGTLTIDIKEHLLEWDVDPDKREKLKSLEILLVPFEHTMAAYTGLLSTDMDMATLVSQRKSVMDSLRSGDKGGREIIDGHPVQFGAMDCLIIKERVPDGLLGPDRLRLNLGQSYTENVVIERVVKRRPSPSLDNGLNLAALLRRGLRRLYILPGDKPMVVPWANTLQAQGFLEHYEDVRPDGTVVMRGEAYEGNDIEVVISADKKEFEFSMRAASSAVDHQTGLKTSIPAKHIIMKKGQVTVEDAVLSKAFGVEALPAKWNDLPRDALAGGLITLQKSVCNPPQDLGSFIVVEVNGQPALFYIASTNHGSMNRGNRQYTTILDNPSLVRVATPQATAASVDDASARIARLQDLANKWHLNTEKPKKDGSVGQKNPEEGLEENSYFNI